MPKTTISDVAKAAGVSTMTVSRVLNSRGEITEQTRVHVQNVIDQLNYRPSALARNLKTKRTFTIGLIVPDITNPFFPELVRGAEDIASEEGYAIILFNTIRDTKREIKAFELLEDRRVDGLISCSSGLSDDALIPLLKRHEAVVVFDRVLDAAFAGSVRIDDVFGAISATNHLLELGRKRLALLAGPGYYMGSKQRRYGFRVALETRGIRPNSKLEVPCEPDEAGGYQATKSLIVGHGDIDGIFCFNDLVALGALEACQDLGKKVPEDIAIVGFDDLRLASLATPQLTTLRVDKYELGRVMVQMLLERIGDRKTSVSERVLQPKLIIRQSAPAVEHLKGKNDSGKSRSDLPNLRPKKSQNRKPMKRKRTANRQEQFS